MYDHEYFGHLSAIYDSLSVVASNLIAAHGYDDDETSMKRIERQNDTAFHEIEVELEEAELEARDV